jgi:hypothetical protein
VAGNASTGRRRGAHGRLSPITDLPKKQFSFVGKLGARKPLVSLSIVISRDCISWTCSWRRLFFSPGPWLATLSGRSFPPGVGREPAKTGGHDLLDNDLGFAATWVGAGLAGVVQGLPADACRRGSFSPRARAAADRHGGRAVRCAAILGSGRDRKTRSSA